MKQTKHIQIREFGLLLKGGDKQRIDCHSISSSAFEWLLINGQSCDDKSVGLIQVTKYHNTIALKVVNYVGVLETPCGTQIEILPKISQYQDTESMSISTKILLKMLSTVNKLPLKQFKQSRLKTLKQPLFEILIGCFLQEVVVLIKRGIRSEYKRVEAKMPYLKGQLQTAKQIRQRPGCHNCFHIAYDQYSIDRPENRLIKASVRQVIKWTRSNDNHRLAHELLFILNEVPCPQNHLLDFAKWSNDRSVVHYRGVKPWCELILSYQCPLSLSGQNNGISFLFPMEKLFERYVAIKLKASLSPGLELKTQTSSRWLVTHKSNKWFKLEPDIVIKNKLSNKPICVADTKWKLIDKNLDCGTHKYNISQSDLYQMLAYGQKYLAGMGTMYLIYPAHTLFDSPLAPFHFDDDLTVKIVPYDLISDQCEIVI